MTGKRNDMDGVRTNTAPITNRTNVGPVEIANDAKKGLCELVIVDHASRASQISVQRVVTSCTGKAFVEWKWKWNVVVVWSDWPEMRCPRYK